MRRCEACNGPGPCLWADSGPNHGRYCCALCHPEPGDPFFVRHERPEWRDGQCTAHQWVDPGHCGVCHEAEPKFTRAGGDVVCAVCGKKYYDHPRDASPAATGYDGSRPLAVLCDGRRVKL